MKILTFMMQEAGVSNAAHGNRADQGACGMRQTHAVAALLLTLLASIASASPANDKLPVIHVNTQGLSPLQTGLAAGEQAKRQFPDIERRYDAWLAQLFTPARFEQIQREQLPALLKRLDVSRQQEMLGVGGAWQLARDSKPGDGQLSLEEYQLLNLLPDLGLTPDGVGVGAFGRVTADGATIVGHNLEWRNSKGARNLQAITVYTSEDVRFATIGLAGMVSAQHGFNANGLFAALINAEPYSPYQGNRPALTEGQQPASFAIRQLLETASSVRQATRLLDNTHHAFAHSILLADTDSVQVLEYSPEEDRYRPHYWNSTLNTGKQWDHRQQLAVVDCLVLASMPDTCRDAKDNVRWQRLDELMQFTPQQPASSSDIASILFDTRNKYYELFTPDTLQSLYFLPASNSLYVYAPTSTEQPTGEPSHQAYLDLLPPSPPWKFHLEWFIWPLILLMLAGVIWVRKTSKPRKDEIVKNC